MNEELQQVKKEISALEERHMVLSLKKELTDAEKYELEHIPLKLEDRRLYRQTLVTSFAKSQGTVWKGLY